MFFRVKEHLCVERDFSSAVDLVSPMRCSLNSKTISATVFKSMAQGRKLIVLYLVVYNYLKFMTCYAEIVATM
jgi:hypothetical protein